MTDAQWKVKVKQMTDEAFLKLRAFRKECVTRGLVKFKKSLGTYEVWYRGGYVMTFMGLKFEDDLRLKAAWSAIQVAEEKIKQIEEVIHGECRSF